MGLELGVELLILVGIAQIIIVIIVLVHAVSIGVDNLL